MPDEGYDKTRVAQTKYEQGGVQVGGDAPKDIAGKEVVKTERAGGGK